MVELISNGVFLYHGTDIVPADSSAALDQQEVFNKERAYKETMAYRILMDHQQHEGDQDLRIKFDALTSHDITYVGIIQTAIASGLDKFPIPYILTNCHNSLAAVGGTINEDDHVFGLSAVQRFGGVYVPPHLAVIHQYMRETMAGCGKMILGSDSHTRYGALGTMAIGEGGPELVKQLLGRTYDVQRPEVIAIYLDGKPKHGVGPQDVALAIEKAVFANGFVKNKVMEFVGPGIKHLSMDFRNGIDVMTTETTCLTTIWRTDSNLGKLLDKNIGLSSIFWISKDFDNGDNSLTANPNSKRLKIIRNYLEHRFTNITLNIFNGSEDNEDNNETRLYLTESELQEFALDLLNLVREVIFSLKNAIQISENEKQSTLSSEVALIPINYEEVDLEDKL